MSSQSFIAQPTSRKNIRELANLFRGGLGMENEKYIPVLDILELALPILDEGFHYEIQDIASMGTRHGLTYPDQKKIIIREDVYYNAYNGFGRDRFTVAHEIGHYLLHHPKNIAAARVAPGQKIPAYLDPEWQAHTFAGELLAPPHIIRGMSVNQISDICGITLPAARIQYNSQNK